MFPKPEEWTEGVYFGLPASLYHSLPWLGSSNVKELYSSPPDYWFNSHMNPLREPEEESFALKFGTAIHDRILYGEDYFKNHYTRVEGGNKDGSVDADGLKKWIQEQGGMPSKLKADNEKMVRDDFNTTLVAGKVFDKIMVSAAMILKNPNLQAAFTNGWPEVSIFWKQDGVPCKCRIDWLKLRAIVDLKSFRSKERISQLDRWVLQDLYNYRYDIQQAHYLNGHAAAGPLVSAGKVFVNGETPRPTDEWLLGCFSTPPGWVFVFYKADGMPIAKSYQIASGGPVHQIGAKAAEHALQQYRDHMAKFGTDAWVNLDPPYQLDDHDIPKWI